MLLTACSSSDDTSTAVQNGIGLSNGWNLGNTLDACSYGNKNNLGLDTENSWGMPTTTQKMIQEVAAKGFKSIRVPVSWHNHITDASYKIDSTWMNRVKTIVDWSLNAGLRVIINIHHDNLKESEMNTTYGFCVPTNANSSLKTQSIAYITAIWTQVSEAFASYDERLVFELLNEPRCRGTSYEWNGGSYLATANKIICEYEQMCLNVIRASGGNNAVRYVMVAPYAASPGATNGWSMPTDATAGRLIVSMHAYTPYSFAMSDDTVKTFTQTGDIDYLFNNQLNTWVKKGYPVVVGEMSATDKANTSERLKWFQYYCGKAKENSIPVILWDNMTMAKESGGQGDIKSGECHGYFNRNTLSWYFPTLVAVMVQ